MVQLLPLLRDSILFKDKQYLPVVATGMASLFRGIMTVFSLLVPQSIFKELLHHS